MLKKINEWIKEEFGWGFFIFISCAIPLLIFSQLYAHPLEKEEQKNIPRHSKTQEVQPTINIKISLF